MPGRSDIVISWMVKFSLRKLIDKLANKNFKVKEQTEHFHNNDAQLLRFNAIYTLTTKCTLPNDDLQVRCIQNFFVTVI